MVSDRDFGRWGLFAELVACVAGGVLLVSISAGVERKIDQLVSNPLVQQVHVLDASRIELILRSLTVAVLLTVLGNLVVTAFVLGQMTMRSRRHDIVVRRTSGARPARLLVEFMREAALWAVVGALIGQAYGVALTMAVGRWTPLPTALAITSWWLVWPLAALAVTAANFGPARTATTMPAKRFESSAGGQG